MRICGFGLQPTQQMDADNRRSSPLSLSLVAVLRAAPLRAAADAAQADDRLLATFVECCEAAPKLLDLEADGGADWRAVARADVMTWEHECWDAVKWK